ncbi:hypothetical protein OX284_013760 [Flavobacterium sp. SUN046]|uniref:hypothetical protein n=1 Tax=Flavobacterium sp. SUN046 TaxID=3002440 RepID=UPI002DB6DAA3|nr:hypothetical protein [Flavobacterium sp. SUN046]MEC4050504.1 hypothetical protein [Flavobacterium sp. SUN046]
MKSQSKKAIPLETKFGSVTEDEVILNKNYDINKIQLENINQVNLIKKRFLLSNVLLMLLSLGLLVYTYFNLKASNEITFSLAVLCGVLFVIALNLKFHFYKLVIKEKNNAIHVVSTSQLHRKGIKELYTSIARTLSKD